MAPQMNQVYDVFISYRRATGKSPAGQLAPALEKRGYSVFFDRSSIRHGKFNETIDSAIRSCSVFILMMTEGSLDDCVSEDDWVRREIACALKHGKEIVPVAPSDQKWSWPATLPEAFESAGLRNIQVQKLDMESLFDLSIDKIVKDCFPRLLQAKIRANHQAPSRDDAAMAFDEWRSKNHDDAGAPGDLRQCGGGFAQWCEWKTRHSQRLFLSPDWTCREVHGEISRCYHQFGGIDFNPSLGFPLSEEEPYAYDGGGDGWLMQRFEKGTIVWRPDYNRAEIVLAGRSPSESFRTGKPMAIKNVYANFYVSAAEEGIGISDDPDEVAGGCLCARVEGIGWDKIESNSWEKFFKVENDDGTWSCLSLRTDRYVSVQADGTLKANACTIGPHEKFKAEPFHEGTVKIFSVGAGAYVEAYRSPLVRDRLLRADCRGSEPDLWEEFVLEDAAGTQGPRTKKVAIVGVEGSGKTVMLVGLGDLYKLPDANGFFLSPVNCQTMAYVRRQIDKMRGGQWPGATGNDTMQALDWTLSRQNGKARPWDLCTVSFLDFAGEVYRSAFGDAEESHAELAGQVKALRDYLRSADEVLVLVNLSDVVVKGLADPRTEEAMWISSKILETVLDDEGGSRKAPRTAVVLSQSDRYANTIEEAGGPFAVLKKYLPHLAARYEGRIDVFAASTVDRTKLDDDGNVMPARDFTFAGLQPLMDWIIGGVAEAHSPLTMADAKRAFGVWRARNIKSAGEPGEIRRCGDGFVQKFRQIIDPETVKPLSPYCQRLFLSPNGLCRVVLGGISRCYHQFGMVDFNPALGFPTSEEKPYPFAGGGEEWLVQEFEKGAIVWRPDYCRTEIVKAGDEPSRSFREGKPVAIKGVCSNLYVSVSDVGISDEDEDVIAERNLGCFHVTEIDRSSVWGNSWEKFFVVENADGTSSFLSFRTHRYVSVQADGTLKANACEIGPQEKFKVEPFREGIVTLFSVGAGAYVQAYMSPPTRDRLLRADCRGREPDLWEEFAIEDASDVTGT